MSARAGLAKPGGGPDRFSDAFRAGLARCSAQARAARGSGAREASCLALAPAAPLTRARAPAPAQVQAYGACVQAALPAVERGSCEKEFSALRACFFAAARACAPARPSARCARLRGLRGLRVRPRGALTRAARRGGAQVKDARKGR
jgi:hypothetical protein